MPYRVLLYYYFCKIDDPAEFAAGHDAFCRELGLRGRILVADEGINGTVSGTTESCDAYIAKMRELFPSIEFKIDEVDAHQFKKLFVRVRDEVITLGVPIEHRPEELTAPHLSPSEWKQKMSEPDTVIVDTRNDYEWSLGRFEGAICPPIESFRELPNWLLEHKEEWAGKQILTYCTGGIRCEKLTTWMLEAGFENVYQLHGGIVMYGKDPATAGENFEGVNVVFDDRVVTEVGPKASPLITTCMECGAPSANYVNCANTMCNARIILCADCEVSTGRCCSDSCREAPTKREKNRKVYESIR